MSRTALRSKRIYTGLTAELTDGYVIWEDGKILFAGPAADAEPLLDPQTRILAMDDAFVMPGFHDFHVHLLSGALMERDGILRYAGSEEEAAKMLWEKNKDRRSKTWILGGAWDNFRWPGSKLPSRESLDQYFKDTPVFLLNKECHGAWANSEALRRFNITKETPDPENGSFFRDESGRPTGYVHEAAVIPMLKDILGKMSVEEMADYAESFAEKANTYGITSVGDLPLYGIRGDRAYKLLKDQGRLKVRINFCISLMENLSDILEARAEYTSDLLRFIGVKDFLDGTPMGHTGFMLEPYTDMPDFRSKPMIEPEVLKTRVALMAANNIKVRLHACGDAAVRLGLDAFAYAKETCKDKDLRHCIEHIESISPDDIGRFGQLNVIPSVQPDHLPKYDFDHHPFHRMIGEKRMRYSWPFRSLAEQGAVLAFGTDYPVTELNPLRGIYRAVTRLTDEGEPKDGFSPDERLSVHQSLKAYTAGSAYAAGRETETGILYPGMLADLTVLAGNPFDCALDREKMFNMKVLMTVVGGETVYGG
ncbi:amidohydrolase [Ihubacter massiliensis]|uniref:Amidohydrolase n=1 Tax=Hominibacterium faecale TaxID=2839743 RepID=A0A9J6QZA4_9FIRM|nr:MULTISPECIES: amidohydrolase [Eubacteriales Family XIII. Incertae Sedis]MCC2864371.1 amidohydrolase [Anaerovorax odorimutans]MCI7302515.1 amidohydrolase [Clostridia bacterium]MDY3011397.1 amidohydrolase [Clostridiales Family XIII bacterium]MCO7124109.1 amidohydrolase [Ihubacter massiliensis]MCU7380799.1 amidohydrolase [Hominibacterium faecale]